MALTRADHRRVAHKPSARSANEFGRRDHPCLVSPTSTRTSEPGNNKWFKEPKIPIHMNMSTMIRMKSKENQATLDHDYDDGYGGGGGCGSIDRRMSTFSLSNSNRRMFDYMQEKFEIVKDERFVGRSYTKNLFWRIVAEHEGRERKISANPCGDGFPENGTYQRVAAINVKGASGCNLQYIEKISIQSKAKSGEVEGSSSCGREDRFDKNLSATKGDQGCGESTNELEARKKKTKKSGRKPVVVTCLKNSSIKYVRK